MVNKIISQVLIYLADFSKAAHGFGSIGSAGVHYGWLLILFFIFAILLVALNFGRSRMLLALLSLYIAAFLEPHFIYFDKLKIVIKNQPDYWLHLGLFFIIYVVVFAVLAKSLLRLRFTLSESSLFAALSVGVIELGFLAAIVFQYLPAEVKNKIPEAVRPYLATKNAQFWWALLPIIALLFSKNKKKRGSADYTA